MIPYILHVTVIIAACFLFYKLLLQKETFYRLNRWTLLLCLAVSFSLPFLPVPQQWSWRSSYIAPAIFSGAIAGTTTDNPVSPGTKNASATPDKPVSPQADPTLAGSPNTPGTAQANPPGTAQANPPGTTQANAPVIAQPNPLKPSPDPSAPGSRAALILHWLSYLYLFGATLLIANILLQIAVLLVQAYTRPVVRDGRFRIVEMSGDRAPCSFGNNIFINPAKYDWDTYNQILLHEKIHVRQRHSIDILMAEIVLALQWFNPFAWLYRKEVENNLEFLTDQSLLKDHEVERSDYQLNLLKVSAPHLPLGITTNYNQSLLKRRIVMMNSKSSSFHTIWKYFFLLPLLTCLVCALNKPAALGQSTDPAGNIHVHSGGAAIPTEGSWFVTTKSDEFCFTLKDNDNDENHSWSNSTCIPKTEFASLPATGKCEFNLVREAGTLFFTGQFDGQQGYGHYTFKPDQAYFDGIRQMGISNLEDNEQFAFFLLNIKKSYIDMLQHNGFPDVSKDNLFAMSALHVDYAYIQSWKKLGYTDLSESDIIAAKAMKVDSSFIRDLQNAGYTHLELHQLIAFKAQGINGDYVRQIRHFKDGEGPKPGSGPSPGSSPVSAPVPAAPVPGAPVPSASAVDVSVSLPPADEIIAYKSLKVDSAYLESLKKAGYSDIPYNEITAMRSLHIDADFILSFENLGYQHIPIHTLITLKSLKITPDYIQGFQHVGYKDIQLDQLPALKSLKVTPEYIKGFQDLGYPDVSLNQLPALKSLGITTDYVKAFRAIGFEHIPIDQLPALKSLGITADYVTSMKAKGFVSKDLNKYIQLKTAFD
jgi:bla regulator protein blaR1